MHDCQKFCEDLADRILAANNPVAPLPSMDEEEIAAELISCESCRKFYRDAKTIVNLLDSAAPRPPELPAGYWQDFSERLQSNLERQPRFFFNLNRSWPLLAFAASLLVVLALGGYHALTPPKDLVVTVEKDRHEDVV